MNNPDGLDSSATNGADEGVISEDTVAEVLSAWTGIPVQKLSTEESAKLLQLEATLHNRVIGQTEAVQAIARAIRRARVRTGARSRRNPSPY